MSTQRVKAAIAKIDSALRTLEGGGELAIQALQRGDPRTGREADRYAALSRRYDDMKAKRTATIERMRKETTDRIRRKDKSIAELEKALEERGGNDVAQRYDALLRDHESLVRRYAALREQATSAVVRLDGIIGAANAGAL